MTTHTWIYIVAGLGMGIITLTSFRLPYLMKYLERTDARFIAQASDDSQRRVAIEHLSAMRHRSCLMAIIWTACFCATFIWFFLNFTAFGAIAPIGAGFGAVVEWGRATKFQSDLRLLKVVDRLKQ